MTKPDTETNWHTLERRVVFSGGPIREVAVETVKLPDGRIIPDYFQIAMADYVLVFAELRDGTVPMLRQYKHGPRRSCLTFPGGAVDRGESPLDAARRELLEELGCVAETWVSLGRLTDNANQGCTAAHLFVASGCEVVGPPQAPDLESPSLVYVSRDELLAAGRIGEIGLSSHVALLLLATHADRSRLSAG